ncbi:hypothetical protein [Tunturiibacter gelidiferens]
MESLLALIGVAIVLFASTNIDDVFVLVAFFPIRGSARETLCSVNM